MERPWPPKTDNQLIVFYSKTSMIFASIVCALMLTMSLVFFYFTITKAIGKIPNYQMAIVIVTLLIFGGGCLWGLISCTKYIIRPKPLLIADKEGIYLNVLVGGKNVLFSPWEEIKEVKLTEIDMPLSKREGETIETIAIVFNQPNNLKFPKIFRALHASNDEIDLNISGVINPYNIVSKINNIKNIHLSR